jgi:bifunctional DNA-binding transcriptional regulator/antitoxin component of YhaV-PrlF toxin-antitoxin module
MPLTETVEFTAALQRGNRIQIPRNIRWRFKLEPDQVLKVAVTSTQSFAEKFEPFYCRMNKDGRITIPALTRTLLRGIWDQETSLEGVAIRARLEPV